MLKACEFLRKNMNISQTELAERINKHQTLIARMVTNIVGSHETALKIAKALKMSKKDTNKYLRLLEEDRLQEDVRKLTLKHKDILNGKIILVSKKESS